MTHTLDELNALAQAAWDDGRTDWAPYAYEGDNNIAHDPTHGVSVCASDGHADELHECIATVRGDSKSVAARRAAFIAAANPQAIRIMIDHVRDLEAVLKEAREHVDDASHQHAWDSEYARRRAVIAGNLLSRIDAAMEPGR